MERVVNVASGLAGIDAQRSDRYRQEAEAERRRAQELEQAASVRQEGAMASTLELMRFLNESQSRQMETIAKMMQDSRESTNSLIMEIRREAKEAVEREREERRRKEEEERNRPPSVFEQIGRETLEGALNRNPVQDLLSQKQVIETIFPQQTTTHSDLVVFTEKKKLEWEMDKWKEEKDLRQAEMQHRNDNLGRLFELGMAVLGSGRRGGGAGGDQSPAGTEGGGFEPIICYNCQGEWVMRPPLPQVATCPHCETKVMLKLPEQGAQAG